MMNVGIITEYYYPLLGGITENVHNTKIRLQQMGHEVKIITSNYNGGMFAIHNENDLKNPDIIRLGRSVSVYSNGSFAHMTVGNNLRIKMKEIMNEWKFDLLHLHSPLVLTLPAIALFEAKCPVVGTFHTYFDSSFIYSILRNTIQRKAMDRLDGKIAVSKSCIDAMSRYFKLNARIIPNGIDINKFNPDCQTIKKFDKSKINLLFMSRFDPRNGLRLMIEAFKIVRSKFPDVRLIIVGDGPNRYYYKQLVPRNLKQDVHFEGLVRDERPSYYATSDIFCSPITKASFGVTLLEAMASGKPIVATENRGYKDLLSPNAGFLVPQNEPSMFADKILQLIKDDKLRQEIGFNGRQNAIRYSWDNIVCEIVDYYNEILKK